MCELFFEGRPGEFQAFFVWVCRHIAELQGMANPKIRVVTQIALAEAVGITGFETAESNGEQEKQRECRIGIVALWRLWKWQDWGVWGYGNCEITGIFLQVSDKSLYLHSEQVFSDRIRNVSARMAELVDALVSNTSGAIRAGSIPAPGTDKNTLIC